jgi:hypothetical protein
MDFKLRMLSEGDYAEVPRWAQNVITSALIRVRYRYIRHIHKRIANTKQSLEWCSHMRPGTLVATRSWERKDPPLKSQDGGIRVLLYLEP